jgi:hypothetical protein
VSTVDDMTYQDEEQHRRVLAVLAYLQGSG